MKVLLLGDASNYHASLAVGLTRLGHDVTVASNGSTWMNTRRNIDLSRSNNRLGGALLWLKLNTVFAPKLRGYDVVQIHNPNFVNLKPSRIRPIFDRLRRDNGGVFLTALATDSPYVDMCLSENSPLRYSEFMAGKMPTPHFVKNGHIPKAWQGSLLSDHCKYIYDNIDGAVSALYEYHLSLQRILDPEMIAYGGIPIDTSVIDAYTRADSASVHVLVACHKGREAEKGIDRLLPMVRDAVERCQPSTVLDIVQNVPFDVFRSYLAKADIVVDQLYSYTPATTALMAMAAGKIVVSGAEPEFYDFIGERSLRPIINADPLNLDSVRDCLTDVILNADLRASLSTQAREFVIKHNDVDVVARRFVDFWERRLR